MTIESAPASRRASPPALSSPRASEWTARVDLPAFRRLIDAKRRVISLLLGGSLGFFFLVLLLAGYARPLMAAPFAGPLNVGYALLLAIYAVSWGAALLYTYAAHHSFDPLAREAVREAEAGRAAK